MNFDKLGELGNLNILFNIVINGFKNPFNNN